MDLFAIHVELSKSWEELAPFEEQESEVFSLSLAAEKVTEQPTCGDLSSQCVTSCTTRVDLVLPLIATIHLSSDPLSDDGVPQLENKSNPITLAAADQLEPLEVILSLTASPTCSATVPIP